MGEVEKHILKLRKNAEKAFEELIEEQNRCTNHYKLGNVNANILPLLGASVTYTTKSCLELLDRKRDTQESEKAQPMWRRMRGTLHFNKQTMSRAMTRRAENLKGLLQWSMFLSKSSLLECTLTNLINFCFLPRYISRHLFLLIFFLIQYISTRFPRFLRLFRSK